MADNSYRGYMQAHCRLPLREEWCVRLRACDTCNAFMDEPREYCPECNPVFGTKKHVPRVDQHGRQEIKNFILSNLAYVGATGEIYFAINVRVTWIVGDHEWGKTIICDASPRKSDLEEMIDNVCPSRLVVGLPGSFLRSTAFGRTRRLSSPVPAPRQIDLIYMLERFEPRSPSLPEEMTMFSENLLSVSHMMRHLDASQKGQH